jgi:predicted N-formylglutamate amidohydrolase
MKIIISCEHGGNNIPQNFKKYFSQSRKILQTHAGLDIGALSLAKKISKKANYFISSTVSRLLIDLNRSLHHPKLFSDYTKNLAPSIKENILSRYYLPYRKKLISKIKNYSQKNQVIHLSVHSFTPTFNNVTRTAEIGLLFDPRRDGEKKFCTIWKKNLRQMFPEFRIRCNYPYLGTADGFTTLLRTLFNKKQYLGIELELNQALFKRSDIAAIKNKIMASFFETINNIEER